MEKSLTGKKPSVFMHSLHVELWDWLSKNPDKKKREWVRWKSNGGDIENVGCSCFPCYYCKGKCDNCPVEWPLNNNGYNRCDNGGGLWAIWNQEEDPAIRSILAIKIRDVPIKHSIAFR